VHVLVLAFGLDVVVVLVLLLVLECRARSRAGASGGIGIARAARQVMTTEILLPHGLRYRPRRVLRSRGRHRHREGRLRMRPEQGRNARETAGRVYALLTGLIRRYHSETMGPKSGSGRF
jgi:hypothetical protein